MHGTAAGLGRSPIAGPLDQDQRGTAREISVDVNGCGRWESDWKATGEAEEEREAPCVGQHTTTAAPAEGPVIGPSRRPAVLSNLLASRQTPVFNPRRHWTHSSIPRHIILRPLETIITCARLHDRSSLSPRHSSIPSPFLLVLLCRRHATAGLAVPVRLSLVLTDSPLLRASARPRFQPRPARVRPRTSSHLHAPAAVVHKARGPVSSGRRRLLQESLVGKQRTKGSPL
jgi:hypothetical protein